MTEDAAEQPGYTPHAGNFTEGNDVASKFKPEYVEQARKLCEFGAVDRELGEFFGVDRRTITNWRHDHPEFAEASAVGKKGPDQRVKRAMYHNSVGFHYTEQVAVKVKTGKDTEKVELIDVERYSPPNAQIQVYWSKNRMKDEFRDRVEHEHDAGGTLAELILKSLNGDA